jgi:hypothetical protein
MTPPRISDPKHEQNPCGRDYYGPHGWLGGLGSVKGCTRNRVGGTRPDEHGAALVDRYLVDLKEFDLEVGKVGVVAPKLALQGSIGHLALLRSRAMT